MGILQWKVKRDLLERAGVGVSQEVVDEALVLTIRLGACAIGDSGGLYDPLITPKIIHQADKAFVQDFEFLIQNGIGIGVVGSGHWVLQELLANILIQPKKIVYKILIFWTNSLFRIRLVKG
jgi:hypothetical protein